MDAAILADAPRGLDAGSELDAPARIDAASFDDAVSAPDAAALDAPSAPDALVHDAPSSPDAHLDDAGSDGGRPPGAGPNVVFVTSTRRAGDFGGIEVADAICRAEAVAAGLPGNFVAWLGSPSTPASARLGSASGWVRPDGLVVATSRASLLSSRLLHSITQLADGAPVPRSSADPYVGGANDCDRWSSASMSVMGGAGRTGSVEPTGDGWGTGPSNRCSAVRPFLCFQVDHTDGVVAPMPVSGRRMFVSDRAAGRTPDVTCQESADAAGLVGSFRAFVPFTGVSAVGRFTLDGRAWVALDGLVVFRDDAAVLTGSAAAPVMYSATGGTPVSSPATGTDDPRTAGSVSNTCSDWTTTGPTESRIGIYHWGGLNWFGWGNDNCGSHASPVFYCAED